MLSSPAVFNCEGGWHSTDEPSEVWHDRGHGHAHTPEWGFGALWSAEALQQLDDLCWYHHITTQSKEKICPFSLIFDATNNLTGALNIEGQHYS